MKSRRSYEIALAAICTGLILFMLWISVVARYGTVAIYIVCSIVLMAPLTKKYYFASIFSYVASSLLAFVIVGDIFSILGFVAYFGPMTLISVIMREKKVKWFVALPIKIVIMNAVLALFYFVTRTLFVDYNAIGLNVHYSIIAIVCTILLVALDYILLYLYGFVKSRIGKVLRDE